MKFLIVFCAVIVAALALPANLPSSDKDAVVVKYDNDNIGVEGYNYAVETSNGIQKQESGQLTNVGAENEAIQARGSFSWTAPDGLVYTVNYVADENGFQPQGAHLPVAP